ncbi:hypothetical protein GCM10014713_57800 [Streptomyces purpureus]|uniref:Uncharacterized protein n=1 Tax=Streptomyces purpureus TaxID=1951 RepID=A0A918HDK4_9ACTN|nr:hypothetical protein GCM10014713_57800 [Streptomyces purpureus]
MALRPGHIAGGDPAEPGPWTAPAGIRISAEDGRTVRREPSLRAAGRLPPCPRESDLGRGWPHRTAGNRPPPRRGGSLRSGRNPVPTAAGRTVRPETDPRRAPEGARPFGKIIPAPRVTVCP